MLCQIVDENSVSGSSKPENRSHEAVNLEINHKKKRLKDVEKKKPFQGGDRANNQLIWKIYIWDVNVPKKIQIFFLWRVDKGILPVRSNLANRRTMVEKTCLRCNQAEESIIFHGLRQYVVAQEIWSILQFD